jgi:hypothetical protein
MVAVLGGMVFWFSCVCGLRCGFEAITISQIVSLEVRGAWVGLGVFFFLCVVVGGFCVSQLLRRVVGFVGFCVLVWLCCPFWLHKLSQAGKLRRQHGFFPVVFFLFV